MPNPHVSTYNIAHHAWRTCVPCATVCCVMPPPPWMLIMCMTFIRPCESTKTCPSHTK